MQLLGEEVNAKVSVLAGGSGGGDADDLARSALQHQEVAEADVMARNGNSVGDIRATSWARAAVSHPDLLLNVHVNVVMVVVRVDNLVSKLVDTLAEGVVVTVLVVVTHVGFLFGACETSWLNRLFGEVSFFLDRRLKVRSTFNGVLVDTNVLGLVLMARGSVYSGCVGRAVTLTIFTLRDVNGRSVRPSAVVNLNTSVVELGVVCWCWS